MMLLLYLPCGFLLTLKFLSCNTFASVFKYLLNRKRNACTCFNLSPFTPADDKLSRTRHSLNADNFDPHPEKKNLNDEINA